tara:strand:+ start:476 stop:850 length:375 start_codon:yes stop_codon:yes gene_type:complete
MEGACVYVDSQHTSVLVMYKEVEKNKVLYLNYSNGTLYHQFITTRLLTQLLPHDCVHILYSLPYLPDSLETTLNNWISIGINRLNILNRQDERKKNDKMFNNTVYNLNINMKFTDFNERFKKTS